MLRKILMIFTLSLSLFGASLNWEKSYHEAKEKALKENKQLFLMVSSPKCPECSYMKKKVFSQAKIKKYINQNYITYQFLHKSEEIPKDMKMWGIPRIYISKGDDKVIGKLFGGVKAPKLLKFLKNSK
ncbi:MAG: thioredoxin family protein [Campylobacterota bacterium]|nr:thioredoxin family protein [Campylobacterota bacterium]